MRKIDLSAYRNELKFKHKILRVLWNVIWFVFARPLPRSFGRKWKIFLLKCFGAKIHKTANIYSTVKIYAPWNLTMKEFSCLAPEVDCYNVDKVVLGSHSIVSQKAYLCTASHDVTKSNNPLITKPIIIGDQSWVAAQTFIGMGVVIGEGAVIGARSAVFKDVDSWTIVGGNPIKFIKKRIIDE